MTHTLVEGWTVPLNITLRSKGRTPAGTMAGMTAELILRNHRNQDIVIPTTGDVSIPDIAEWVVRYTPDASDLVEGIYRLRIKVTDSGGSDMFFPSGDPDTLIVRKVT